jgi:predicted RNase H-like nuclease (RuvC/YqgF family)
MAEHMQQALTAIDTFNENASSLEDSLDNLSQSLSSLDDLKQSLALAAEEIEDQEDRIQSLEEDVERKDSRINELEAELDSLRSEGAADRLLRNYTGHAPSLGDVQKLKGIIDKALVEQFGVSEGTL